MEEEDGLVVRFTNGWSMHVGADLSAYDGKRTWAQRMQMGEAAAYAEWLLGLPPTELIKTWKADLVRKSVHHVIDRMRV